MADAAWANDSRVVLKYTMPIEDAPVLWIPKDGELLTVADQYGSVCLWVRCRKDAVAVPRQFRVAGTGHSGAAGVYVGTVLMYDANLVYHVFDLGEVEVERG